MEITSVDAEVVEATRRFGNVSAVKTVETSTFVMVTLTSSDGTKGLGEISDVEDPESMPSMERIETELEEFLLGRDPRRINKLTKDMYDAVDFGTFGFHTFQQLALSGIDTALHDLVGRLYDVPVYNLLGGRTRDVPVTWVTFTRRQEDEIDALREEIRPRVEEGFTAFKLKVGEIDPAIDEHRIRTVREMAGDDATVLIDAQGVWDVEAAVENIQRFEAVGIDGVETPVGHPDPSVDAPGYYYDRPLLPEELAEVRERTDTPLLEHVHDPKFGLELVEADAVDVFTVEVCAGGLMHARRILNIAAAAGIDARLGSTSELGPGTTAAAALAVSSTAISYPCDLASLGTYEETIMADGIEYQNGVLQTRDAPGFGFEIPEVF